MPSTRSDLTAGIDIGTTSVKAVVVDATGDVVARTRLAHRVIVPAPDRIEHDPRIAWRRSPRRALAALGALELRAVGVCGMGPSLTAVDGKGMPHGPGLIYGDGRGGNSPGGFGESEGFLRALAAAHPDAHGYWPAQTTAIVSLGGSAVTGQMIASMMHPLWNGTAWDEGIVGACGARPAQLPEVVPPGTVAGRTAGGAVIDAGFLDVHCERLMAGVVGPDEVLVLCGSTMVMMMAIGGDRETPGVWSYPTPDGHMATGASNAGGLFLDWVDRVLAPARTTPAPDDVPVWCPYVRGERTPWHDPARRAAVVGLSLAHDAATLRRAAFEASGFVVRHHIDICGIEPRRIVAVGGGTALAGWTQALADCTGVPVETRGAGVGAAIGAAFMARVAAGLEPDETAAARWVRPGPLTEPDPAWVGPAATRYRRFRELVAEAGGPAGGAGVDA
jgi:xylulokinase